MTPFFLPAAKLLTKILEAKRRGVAVEIITPLRTDKPRYDSFRALPAPLLIQNGVSWRGTKKYFHQKFFIFDDQWIMGSANFDIISFERNYELCIRGSGEEECSRKLESIADEAHQKSRWSIEISRPGLFRNLTRACSGPPRVLSCAHLTPVTCTPGRSRTGRSSHRDRRQPGQRTTTKCRRC